MSRPSFEAIYMNLAVALSLRSTCARTNSAGERVQVGCVITSIDHRHVFAVGYNGSYSGGPNDCDRHGDAAIGNCGCTHAESNACVHNTTPSYVPKNVYVTHLPCVACTKMLVNLGGVKRVMYLNDYRIKDGLKILDAVGIEHVHMMSSEVR